MDSFSIDYFKDEVRSGFFIPTEIKQAWAAQLKVLGVIDDICSRHGITYFADWGTVLGAVRHGGYVPWDDDLDICMKRQDYIRFRQVAKTELPKNYCIHDYEHKEEHWLFLSRVVNNTRISFEQEHMDEFFNFPYISGIDIFVLDYVYRDKEKEEKRCGEVKYIIAVADMIISGNISSEAKESNLLKLEREYNKKFDRNLDGRHMGIELYRLAEEQMMRVPESESDRMVQLFPWGVIGVKGFEKKYYDKIVRLPFENTTIPVSAGYNEVLKAKYGDYFKIRKVWSGHEYPFYEGQKANLMKLADFKFPEFTFDRAMLRKEGDALPVRDTMQKIVADVMADMEKLNTEVCEKLDGSVLNEEEHEQVQVKLAQCQQTAIDIGNYAERMKGSESTTAQAVVHTLEMYCETVFEIYKSVVSGLNNSDMEAKLQISFEAVKKTVKKELVDKKLVMFLPADPQRWDEMSGLYEYYLNMDDTEVYVTPLPALRKDMYGRISMSDEELKMSDQKEKYPRDLNIVEWNKTDFSAYGFDAIIIQNPYDNNNPYLTVPASYYSDKLQRCTKCLLYLMPQHINDFKEADVTDVYGIKKYLFMPGAVYADRILTGTDGMKELYVKKLCEFAGADTEKIWNDRLISLDEYIGEDKTDSVSEPEAYVKKKKLLYCIGENEFLDDAEKIFEGIKERVCLIGSRSADIDMTLCIYPHDYNDWTIFREEEKKEFIKLMSGFNDSGDITVTDGSCVRVDEYDAYYGSASPFVSRFVECKKPVLLADYTENVF